MVTINIMAEKGHRYIGQEEFCTAPILGDLIALHFWQNKPNEKIMCKVIERFFEIPRSHQRKVIYIVVEPI